MKKINILLAMLLTLCTTGCIFKIMEDFSEHFGYVFFFKNDSSEDLYVEIVFQTVTSERQLNIGEEQFFLAIPIKQLQMTLAPFICIPTPLKTI